MEPENEMPRQDTVDFLTAFAIGTALGIGATLLLRPARPTAKERILKQLGPYRKRVGRGYKQVRRGMREGTEATADLTGEVISAGRELLGEFREEAERILGEAREELQGIVKEQGRGVARGAKQARRKLGM
jgi:gas vesicle protein